MHQSHLIKESFEDYCASGGINASLLCCLAPPNTPAHALHEYRKRQNGEKDTGTTATRLGTLVHAFMLEPEAAANGLIVKPDGMKFSTIDGKAWKKEKLAKGLAIVTSQEREDLIGMVNSILRRDFCRDAFAHGQSEVSAYCPYESEFGPILRKSRFDHFPPGNAILDIKTTTNASPDYFSKVIWERDYYMRAAFYIGVAQDLGFTEKTEFVFVAVENHPPYLCKEYQLKADAIERGRDEWTRLVELWAKCQAENNWPGYSEGPELIGLPDYVNR